MKALKITGIILLVLVVIVLGAGTYIKVALPNTGRAPNIKIERTAARIQRGEYLANHVNVCMDCHSTRDWSQYAGPMSATNFGGGGERFDQQQGFPGKFFAPNITPYRLKTWTDGEILRAITTGVNKDGKALFPVMTWEHAGQMDKEDVYSIIAYLRTLPEVKHDVPASKADFPVNFILNTMPHPAKFTNRPAETDTLKYGEYLVNAAACVDCHSKMEHGSVVAGSQFGGGMEFKEPGGTVRSPNITSDRATGIGTWSKAMFVNRFKAYADKNYQPAKLTTKDLNTPMPWMMYSGMKQGDLEAIYTYLKSLKPISNTVNKFEKI
ncbi:c-type cytochrome [Mucilaginibacter sp. RS28]|uniref:C-type cytochrome n=1 Tax=Mucilaginibacter straminoryzae TaxID=2932774 RepID=A0A9X1X446_9SPHI|nr:c-type cytochrome [Mucilaginibacter straminoryzae]MCJ8208144.1 c-type cytochrome [Mucilaginibacter straminoryzae]